MNDFTTVGVQYEPHWAGVDDQDRGLVIDCGWERGLEGIVLHDVVLIGTVEDLRQLGHRLVALTLAPHAPMARCDRCDAAVVDEEDALCPDCSEGNSGRVVI